jgi:hypothetical protein
MWVSKLFGAFFPTLFDVPRVVAANGGPSTKLIAVWRTSGGQRFQNCRSVFTILDLAVIERIVLRGFIAGQATRSSGAVWKQPPLLYANRVAIIEELGRIAHTVSEPTKLDWSLYGALISRFAMQPKSLITGGNRL